MKISKFNENQTTKKAYAVYRYDENDKDDPVIIFVFVDEESAENFILNRINNDILIAQSNNEEFKEYIVDNYINIAKYEECYIFTDVKEAIECVIYYDDIDFITYEISHLNMMTEKIDPRFKLIFDSLKYNL